jgi:hypothetical protein
MLDSTGHDYIQTIHCALCPQKAELAVYKPKHGHAGEDLTCGPYLWDDKIGTKLGLPKSLLLKFQRRQRSGEIFFELLKYNFKFDGNPYSYGHHPLVPPFGLGENKVIWVCSSCTQSFNGDIGNIHHFLSDRIDEHYETILQENKIRKKLVRRNKLAA